MYVRLRLTHSRPLLKPREWGMQNVALIIRPLRFKAGYAARGSTSGVLGRSLSTRLSRRSSSAGFLEPEAALVGESDASLSSWGA